MTYDTYGREVTCLCQPAEPMCEACRQLWSGVQAAPEKSTPGPWELKTCLRDEPKLTQLVGADGRHIADFHREADAMVAVQAPAMRDFLIKIANYHNNPWLATEALALLRVIDADVVRAIEEA